MEKIFDAAIKSDWNYEEFVVLMVSINRKKDKDRDREQTDRQMSDTAD